MRSSAPLMLLAAVALATAASLVFAVRAPRAEAVLAAAAEQSEDASGSARRGGVASGGPAAGGAAAEDAAPSGVAQGGGAATTGRAGTVSVPPAADPAVLAARFAVQPGSAPAPAAASATEELPEPAPGGPREASWLSYVGRVGVGDGRTLYYYKDERTGQVVTVGESVSAQYRIVDRGPRTITVRDTEQGVLVLESPQSE